MKNGDSLVLQWCWSYTCTKQGGSTPPFLLFLIPACPTHGYFAFCSCWKVLQSAGLSEASHQLDCLGNARWITAAILFHPLSRIEASRQPNPIQEKAPTNPFTPRLQLQNLIPAALPLVFAQLGGKLAKNECC